jgi:hypothetical protein
VLLALITSLVPATSLAAAERPTPRVSALKAAVATVPASSAPTIRPARSAARATQSQSGPSASFFKTRSGILAIAVMVAGAGYAVYSTQNDRIKSPGAK